MAIDFFVFKIFGSRKIKFGTVKYQSNKYCILIGLRREHHSILNFVKFFKILALKSQTVATVNQKIHYLKGGGLILAIFGPIAKQDVT